MDARNTHGNNSQHRQSHVIHPTNAHHSVHDLSTTYLKYKIVVSGAAVTEACDDDTMDKAKEVGREIVRHNGVLVTGATTGVPLWAAMGAKDEGGIVIGMSPAHSEVEHINKYQLPVEYLDLIIYTGFNYAGRNLLLTRAADAIIVICGRIGTLNEFTVAFEDQKPIGVLEGTGGEADMIRYIVSNSHRGPGRIIYEREPKTLVERLLEMVDADKLVKLSRIPKEKLHALRDG